jgi:hypothetical protein
VALQRRLECIASVIDAGYPTADTVLTDELMRAISHSESESLAVQVASFRVVSSLSKSSTKLIK